MKGIDVSVYQPKILWKKVKSAGYDFAFIKAGQGCSYSNMYYNYAPFEDRLCAEHLESAYRANMKTGLYWFLCANNPDAAEKEAHFFADICLRYSAFITGDIVVDVEARYLPTYRLDLQRIYNRFCNTLRDKRSLNPIVYTNVDWLENRFYHKPFEDLWLAQWNVAEPRKYPNLKYWQYGKEYVPGVYNISGIPLKVDANKTISS